MIGEGGNEIVEEKGTKKGRESLDDSKWRRELSRN